MGSFALPTSMGMTFEAKATTLIHVVSIAKKRKWFPIWVETNSIVLLQKVRSKYMNVQWQTKLAGEDI